MMVLLIVWLAAVKTALEVRASALFSGCPNDQYGPERLDQMTTWGASQRAYEVGARRMSHTLIPITTA